MTRPWTPHEVRDGKKILHVKRCCEQCGREIGDVTQAEVEAAIAGIPLPDVADECGCPAVIEQIAMFAHRRDELAYGTASWDTIGEPGRHDYRKDAAATVRAMVALGWAPSERNAS